MRPINPINRKNFESIHIKVIEKRPSFNFEVDQISIATSFCLYFTIIKCKQKCGKIFWDYIQGQKIPIVEWKRFLRSHTQTM